MSNILTNGTVLPSGLLNAGTYSMRDAHKKTFANYSLKTGIVVKTYIPTDDGNVSKKVPEYDVLAFEQDENRSSTIIRYKNCTVMSSFGSIADYFEANIRQLETKPVSGSVTSPSGQDGSIVLLLCLSGISDKGVIIGCLSHPDRTTNLATAEPHLVGEYNGVKIEVETDGSAIITVNGATENNGIPITPISSPTTITVSAVGEVTVSAPQQAVNINCLNANVIATETAIVDGTTVKLGQNAAQSLILGDLFQQFFNNHIHPTVFGPSGQPVVPMPNSLLSTKVVTE